MEDVDSIFSKIEEEVIEIGSFNISRREKIERYLKAISLSEELAKFGVLERCDIRGDLEKMYRTAFKFFNEENPHFTMAALNYPTDRTSKILDAMIESAIADDAETSVQIAEKARTLLGLTLCNESIIKDLKKKAQEAREKNHERIKEYKEEDDALFFSNYNAWRIANK